MQDAWAAFGESGVLPPTYGPGVLRKMTDNGSIDHETALVLRDAFELEVPEAPSLDDVRRLLAQRIGELLERQPSLLMSLLYRIDVAERDVQRVLSEAPVSAIPEQLADLIVARQLEKVETRRRYRTR